MPKGFAFKELMPLEAVRMIHIDTVLRYFNIPCEEEMTQCPFHNDENASLQINDTWVFCYACNQSWDNFAFVHEMLKRQGKPSDFMTVLEWFTDHQSSLPQSGFVERKKSEYVGPVDPFLVDYWYDCVQNNGHMTHLMEERLLTEETIHTYKLGWRPDMQAWSIPFWRGKPGESEVDIMQFRHTRPHKTKYTGLSGHNRASVMNAHLLEEPQEYVVVLYGTFDPILALQDGIPAVGFNGAGHFITRDVDRLLELFQHQTRVYIVPDNQPEELVHAKQLQRVLGSRASIRTFPEDCPEKEDYTSYRMTHSAEDFQWHILKLGTLLAPDPQLIDNLYELLSVGDTYDLGIVHLLMNPGTVVADVARSLSRKTKVQRYSDSDWVALQDDFSLVAGLEQFYDTYKKWASHSYTLLGGW